MTYWRVKLPPGVRSPFEVYVNGVRQELGVDYRIASGELLFERELVRQKLSGWAWFLGFWGIGTYKRNDEIDVRYEVDGEPRLAHAWTSLRRPNYFPAHPRAAAAAAPRGSRASPGSGSACRSGSPGRRARAARRTGASRTRRRAGAPRSGNGARASS